MPKKINDITYSNTQNYMIARLPPIEFKKVLMHTYTPIVGY